jgi:TetR/AcrR family transcriptional regulator, fatty acid metabolism regulator protein
VLGRAGRVGVFRADVTPAFAALAFYGVIEQVLTRWIFEGGVDGARAGSETPEAEIEEAKDLVVATIVDGLAAPASARAV